MSVSWQRVYKRKIYTSEFLQSVYDSGGDVGYRMMHCHLTNDEIEHWFHSQDNFTSAEIMYNNDKTTKSKMEFEFREKSGNKEILRWIDLEYKNSETTISIRENTDSTIFIKIFRENVSN